MLVGHERNLEHAPPPFALLHFDTRSDNVRIHGDRLRIFDWPFASAGPAELDVVALTQAQHERSDRLAEAGLGSGVVVSDADPLPLQEHTAPDRVRVSSHRNLWGLPVTAEQERQPVMSVA